MSLRRATSADIAHIEALLLRHIQTSMFPLANLRDHGIDGAAPRSLRIWLTETRDSLVAVTNEGMAMPQAPGADAAFWADLRTRLDLPLIGAIGHVGQVRAMLRALGLDSAPTLLDEDEAGFTLDLDRMRLPNCGDAVLRAPTGADADLLIDWRSAYHAEALETPPEKVRDQAAKDIAFYLKRDSHRILMMYGQPVAMTGLNASVGPVVQVGGVYTPPALRGKGYARIAVALHLDQARQSGTTRAVLFSLSDAAVRAYRAIGFEPADPIALVLFDGPQEVTP